MNDHDLRQFLIAHALQGLCANPNIVRGLAVVDTQEVAELAVDMAEDVAKRVKTLDGLRFERSRAAERSAAAKRIEEDLVKLAAYQAKVRAAR